LPFSKAHRFTRRYAVSYLTLTGAA
jgi:hypothetical protein